MTDPKPSTPYADLDGMSAPVRDSDLAPKWRDVLIALADLRSRVIELERRAEAGDDW